ncbi:MAG TPA: imidazole glycerol phosphate synthase subunit HisH [Thermoguttaceae bacterium]|nr:imidazole glycerol phosphate synthase subunit HisH [Thermoguttaceae bacterium]
MIAIIDYGMGNLRSVQKGFERVGFPSRITSDPQQVAESSHLVLPGVGAFGDAMEELRRRGLVEPIREAIEKEKPFLGICLGLQLLFDRSYEDGAHEGLGILPGEVVRFDLSAEYAVPHMGWNQLHIRRPNALLVSVEEGAYVYFVHSYYVVPKDNSVIATETDYGEMFCSSIARGRLFAVQFHPEKSQAVGLRMLENFARLPA